jgi:hypothetical protein
MDFGTRLNISDILNKFPEAKEAANIVPIDVRQVSSSGIIPSDWLALSRTIREVHESNDNIDGINHPRHGNARRDGLFYQFDSENGNPDCNDRRSTPIIWFCNRCRE